MSRPETEVLAVTRTNAVHARVELRKVVRFLIVGGTAAAFHLGAALSLVTYGGWSEVSAHCAGFAIAFCVSFLGHYVWTFERVSDLGDSLVRFGLIALSGFGLNSLLLAHMVASETLTGPSAVVLAAVILPLMTFVVARLWAFVPSDAR